MPITIWIYRGPWADSFRNVSPEEAAQAEKEDWGQSIDGKDGTQMKAVQRGPHKAADAYFASQTGAAQAPAKDRQPEAKPEPEPDPQPTREAEPEPEAQPERQTYTTREVRAREPQKTSHRLRKRGKK